MEQTQEEVLQRLTSGTLTDPLKCSLCLAVYEKFRSLEAPEDVLINYDAAVDEIYIIAQRNGHRSIYIPRSYNQDVDLSKIKHFRKKQILGTGDCGVADK